MLFRGLLRKLIISVALGIAVVVAFGAVSDAQQTLEAIGHFGWLYLPPALGLTLLNYLLRFGKWHYYLRTVGAGHLSLRRSALIFFSSLSMVMTPGKIGEWLKSYLLREMAGTPLVTSAPIVIAERLTDGLAMVILASAGLLLYGYAWQVAVAAVVPAAVIILMSQHRATGDVALSLAARLPVVGRQIHHFQAFYDSSRALFCPRNLALAVLIGVVSWGAESLAFYLITLGLGFAPSFELLVQVTFVLAISTLAGAVALTPGGLAVAEGSIAGLLLLLGVTDERSTAAAATLLIRFCTLWFGVAIGIAFLAAVLRCVSVSGSKGNIGGQAAAHLE